MSSSSWRTRRPLPVVLLMAVFVAPAMSAIIGLGVLSNGDPAGDTAETHVNFDALALNDAGTAVFAGTISGPFGQNEGVWTFATGAASSTLVAREGDLAPGGGEATFGSGLSGTYPNIGSGGHVAFMDNLAGPAGEGVYRTTPEGVLEEVAQTGDVAPGSGGLTFLHVNRSGANGPVPLNSSGDVVVHGQLDEPQGQPDREGIWIGRPNDLSLVVLQNGMAEGFASFSQIGNDPLISDSHVAFDSTMNTGGTPSSATAIWISPIDDPTNIALVASNSDLGASSIELLGINNAEEVVLRANFSGVVVLMAGAAGSLEEAVREGDAAPGTASTFTNFGVSAIGGNGDIVFRGVLASPVNGNGLWHWQASSGTIRLIAFGTGAAPGGGVFNASSFGVAGVEACLSATGKVGFRTTLDTGEAGIWFGDPRLPSGASGAVALVVRDGLPAPVPGPGVDVANLDFFQQGSSTVYGIAGPEDGVPSGCNGMDEFVFRYDPPNTGGGGPRHLQVATQTLSAIVAVPDISGNGIPEIGVAMQGSTHVHIRDAITDDLITDIDLGTDVAIGIAVLPDTNTNGMPEVAALSLRASGQVVVTIWDSLTAKKINTIFYGIAYPPLDMAVLPDTDGNTHPELAVLGVDAGNGIRVQARDALTDIETSRTFYGNNATAIDVQVIPNVNGNGEPEIAMHARVNASNQTRVQLRDSDTGALIRQKFYGTLYAPQQIAVIDDVTGDGVPELAQLAAREDTDAVRIQVKNPVDGSTVSNAYTGNTDRSIDIVGTGGIVGMLVEDAGGVAKVIKRDALTGAFIGNVFMGAIGVPEALVVIDDLDASGNDEFAALGVDPTTGQRVVQIKDSVTGAQINTIDFP